MSDSRNGTRKDSSRPINKPNGTNVSLLVVVFIGTFLAAVFYGAILKHLPQSQIKEMLTERGWVPYIIVLLASWSLTILVLKSLKIRKQRKTLAMDVLPAQISADIKASNVARFQEHLRNLPSDTKHNFLLKRIDRALAHFETRCDVQEVSSLLQSQSDIDANAVDTSYTFLRVMVWAIPILGFVGTVIGVGVAVSQFSNSLQGFEDPGLMKDSLGLVTSGLAVAFDTTLLALVVSLLIMFPMSSLQKIEEDLLVNVEELCNEQLLGRLSVERVGESAELNRVQEALSFIMSEHRSELHRWFDQLNTIGTVAGKQLAKGCEAIHEQIVAGQKGLVAEFQTCLKNVSNEHASWAKGVQAAQKQSVQELTDNMASMSQTASSIQEELLSIQHKQTQNFSDVIAALSDDMKAMQRQAYCHQEANVEHLHEMATALSTTFSSLSDNAKVGQEAVLKSVNSAASDLKGSLGQLNQACHTLSEQVDARETQLQQADVTYHNSLQELTHGLNEQSSLVSNNLKGYVNTAIQLQKRMINSFLTCQQKLDKNVQQSTLVQRHVNEAVKSLSAPKALDSRLDRVEFYLGTIGKYLKHLNAKFADSNLQGQSTNDKDTHASKTIKDWMHKGRKQSTRVA